MIVIPKNKLIDDAFGNWLAGFIDGEGCFAIRNNRGPAGASLVCDFHINLRSDDEPILREIVERTGLGRIYQFSGSQKDRKAQPEARLVISRRQELFELIELLDRCPLRAKKAHDYALWREAVHVWGQAWTGGWRGLAAKEHNIPIWNRMAELRQQLMTGRIFVPVPR